MDVEWCDIVDVSEMWFILVTNPTGGWEFKATGFIGVIGKRKREQCGNLGERQCHIFY